MTAATGRTPPPRGTSQPVSQTMPPMFRFLVDRFRHWFSYKPERRYMRGGG